MNSGKFEDIVKNNNILTEILKSKNVKQKSINPLVLALTIIGGITVAFALFYAFYNLVSGNAYKDVDEDEEEFEEEETVNAE